MTQVRILSRRDFLKLSISGAAGLFLSSLPLDFVRATGVDWQGRVARNNINMYDQPSVKGELVRMLMQDDLFPITAIVTGGNESDVNRIWYQAGDEGFVHSSFVQPVKLDLNEPSSDPLFDGALGEVTVPFVDCHARASLNSMTVYRMYYETTYWISRKVKGDEGSAWYRIYDDLHKMEYFVPAEYLRVVPALEFTPLSPDVDPGLKRIEVHLDNQELTAYEDETPVYSARISSGKKIHGRWSTPPGRFKTFHKRHSRHMAAGNLASGGYDLPGVPWVTYITQSGISFHGTFWHNDFGTPHSHGCINLSTADAKWLYRWTIPTVQPEEQYAYKFFGTQVDVMEA